MHIAHDADDGERPQIAVHVTELDELAQRVLARPAPACQGGADHCDVRRAGGVPLVEQAAADQRDAHDAEVVFARDAEVRVAAASWHVHEAPEVLEVRDFVRPPQDDERSVRVKFAVQREVVHATHALDARERAEPLDQPLQEAGDPRMSSGVRPVGEPHVHHECSAGAIARVYCEQLEESSPEQSGADEQHDRQCDLGRDEGPAYRSARYAASLAAGTVGQRVASVGAGCPDRGDHADRDRGQQGDGEREGEHRPIHTDLAGPGQSTRLECQQQRHARHREEHAEAGSRQ